MNPSTQPETSSGATPTPAPALPLAGAGSASLRRVLVELFDAEILTTLDHRNAELRLPNGTVATFTSEPGKEPTALAQARDVAKAAFKAAAIEDAAKVQAKRDASIREAKARADKARGN